MEKSLERVGDWVCMLPKHRGLKWKEVVAQDPNYCKWLLDNGVVKNENVKQYLIAHT